MGHPWNQRSPHPRPGGLVAQGVIAIVAIVALGACGGGAAQRPSPSVNPQAAALAFSKCMRQHGVNVPDPVTNGTGGGGGFAVNISGNGSGPKPTAALAACQKYLPRIGGSGSQTPDPAREAQLLKFAQSMRAHGIDMPDPQTSGGGVILGGPAGGAPNFDPSSTAFKNAQTACQHYLPGKGGGMSVQGNGAAGAGSGPVSSGSGQ